MDTGGRSSHQVLFESFEVNLRSGELKQNGERVKLPDQSFQILAMLLERRGEILTRQEIQARLWPNNTVVEFETSINAAIRRLRAALGDSADQPRYIETLARRGYRWKTQVEWLAPGNGSTPQAKLDNRKGRAPAFLRTRKSLGVVGISVGLLAVVLYYRAHDTRLLTEKDTVVLAEFENKTGDAAFDGALREAFAAELKQSPFLNVISDRKISETLRMMGQSSGQSLGGDAGREVCIRTGSKALLSGRITALGSHYLLSLVATGCDSGETLARQEGEASGKDNVLNALSRACSHFRHELGETLPSVRQFKVPIEASTSSLEALKNYSVGLKTRQNQGSTAGIPYFKRAIELDPDFPMAYVSLSLAYDDLQQPSLALDAATKAYELRERANERERLEITAAYFAARGDITRENETYELWKTSYPREITPYIDLAVNYNETGQFEKSLSQANEAVRLDPESHNSLGLLATTLTLVGRLDEAKAVFESAFAHGVESVNLRGNYYILSFLRGDAAVMKQQLVWAESNPADADLLFSMQSDTDAYYGRLSEARDVSRRAVASAVRSDSKEAAALWRVNAALREAEVGNKILAERGVFEALGLSSGRNVKVASALTLARIGDIRRAQKLSDEIKTAYPNNTLIKFYWLPTITAAIHLADRKPNQALVDLEPTSQYELGEAQNFINYLYPVYVRGEAYLKARNGQRALLELQKLIDHRCVVDNFLTGSLVHLQMGRAYAMTGNVPKARDEYERFLALWKDADPDVTILKSAKAENARLRN